MDRVARINASLIEVELQLGQTLAEMIAATAAHELGHSCWLEHHGNEAANATAASKGPACIMRYSYLYEPVFCPYATPCEGGSNVETEDPAIYGLDSWNCEPGRGDCLHRIRVNPVNYWPLEK